MSGDKNEHEDAKMKAFEAALASLRPLADRFDAGWRSLLAKEALLTAELAAHPSTTDGNEDCDKLGGHQFVCVRCGSAAQKSLGIHGWAWPTAFSTMTTVAAILLVMVLTRTDRQAAEHRSEQDAARSAPLPGNNTEDRRQSEVWSAIRNVSRSPLVFDNDELRYLDLRDHVLRNGGESWKFQVSAVAATSEIKESPLSYREQLNCLLKQQGSDSL